MSRVLNILGLAGSLREGSYNRALLRAALDLVPQDTRLDIFDLEGIPLFNQDLEKSVPEKVKEFKAKIKTADAVLIVTPEHNYSIPGVLKNAIDWASTVHRGLFSPGDRSPELAVYIQREKEKVNVGF